MPGATIESELNLPVFGSRNSLRENVADALRASLVSGRMKPGELFSAPKLAEQFGVSATPVREAMLDLAAEGLIEVVRNKGFRVTRVSLVQLDHLAEVRLLIEPPIMAAIATDPDERIKAEVEKLRPIAQATVQAAAAENPDFVAYGELDSQFHLRFLSLHENDELVDVVRDLRKSSRLVGLEELAAAGLLEPLAHDHEQMVDLVLAGKPEQMRQLVANHIGRVRTNLASLSWDD